MNFLEGQNNQEQTKNQKLFWICLLIVGFLAQVYLIYYGYIYFKYLVPPGYDFIPHYAIIERILSEGKVHFGNYPPLFHLIVIGLSKLFHVDPLNILTYWTPLLIVLPSLSMYFLLRQLFSIKVSVISTLILLLTSGFPLYAFVDGNYPDMLAYGVFTPLMIGFFIRYFKTQKARNLIFGGLFLPLIALSHHFTFVNIVAILIIFGVIQVFSYVAYRRGQWRWPQLLSLGALLLFIFLSIWLADKIYGQMISKFFDGLINNEPALKAVTFNQLIEYQDYPKLMGGIVWYGGLLGIFYLLLTSLDKKQDNKAKLFVVIWFLYFFLMSRIAATSIPSRFGRELALPLIVGIAFLIDYISVRNPDRLKNWQSLVGYGLIGFLLVTNSALHMGLARIPNSFSDLIWYWPKDQEKMDWLSQHIGADNPILYNPKANLVVPLKTKNDLVGIELTTEEMDLARKANDNPNDKALQADYLDLLLEVSTRYSDEKYVFIDVKPPGNPDEILYPTYYGFGVNNQVLGDMTSSSRKWTELIQFADGAKVLQRVEKTTKTSN